MRGYILETQLRAGVKRMFLHISRTLGCFASFKKLEEDRVYSLPLFFPRKSIELTVREEWRHSI
jgi:hypothetical protein